MGQVLSSMHPVTEIVQSQSESERDTCPQCGSSEIYIKDIQEVCISCGADFGATIDYKPEWRNDSSGEDMSRCNLAKNPMLPESSYSTTLAIGPNATKSHYDLQRTLIWSSIPHNERSMKTKMDDISHVCKNGDIPTAIIEYAHSLYYRLINELEAKGCKRKRGNNDKGMRAGAVFLAFQDDGKPRTYKEIALLFNIEPKYVSEAIKLYTEYIRSDRKVTIYSDYIDEFCDSLNLSDEIKTRVTNVADKAESLGVLENHTPTSIIAGCIWYVTVEMALTVKITDIESWCNVSAPTINKVCDKLFRRATDLSED